MRQYTTFLLLLAMLSSESLYSQTSDFQTFLSKARQHESAYLQKDSVMRIPFVGQQSSVNWYYEILFEGEEAIFLEQVFYGMSQKGHQLICKCEAEKTLDQLERQLAAWQSSRISIDMDYMNFQQRYCLNETITQPLSDKIPKLKGLLSGKGSSLPEISTNPDVNGQWLKAENGHWILDLFGHLPKGYTFDSFADEQELHYIKEKGTLLYPPSYAPQWKRTLISSGRFGKNIINNPDNNNYNRQNNFSPFQHTSSGQAWNILFHWQDSLALSSAPGEASGKIYINVLTDEIEEETSPLPGLFPGEQSTISCNGKVIMIQNLDKPNQAMYSMEGRAGWTEAIIKDKEGRVLVSYSYGKVGRSIQLSPVQEGEYNITLFYKKPEWLEIPFSGNFPVNQTSLYQKTSTPVFQYFIQNHKWVEAEYVLELPLDTFLQSFQIYNVRDDKRKDLTKVDKIPTKWVDIDHDTYAKYANRYELRIGNFAPPTPDANEIIISGAYMLTTENGTMRTILWADTLGLAKMATTMEKTIAIADPSPQAQSTNWLQIGSLYNSLGRHGLFATIPFPIPEETGNYYGLASNKCKVVELYDDQGNDLIAAHRSTFDQRILSAKTSRMQYYSDEALNREQLVRSDMTLPHPEKSPEFNLQVYVGAGKGANKIFGTAKLVYYTYNEKEPLHSNQTLKIMRQDLIVVSLPDDQLFQFKYSSFDADAKDGREFTNYRYVQPKENPQFYPGEVVVKDQEGTIVSLQKEEAYTRYFEAYNLTFPEEQWGEYTIDITYYQLKELTIEVPFMISLGGE
jgi:hypothetical protein